MPLWMAVLSLPKEFPYAKKAKIKLKNVFALPFHTNLSSTRC